MDRALREQALDFFFKPTETLLRQYGRFVEPKEVTAFRRRFDDLKLDLGSAFINGDAYEAYLIRQELKEAYRGLRQRIDLYKREAVVKV